VSTAYDATLALSATGLLAEFNRAGILSAADVHVARRLGAISGETDDAVLLAAALVVRSTRHGSVVLDLATAEATTSPDVDVDDDAVAVVEVALAWPGDDWMARCAASPLLTGPLRMAGSRVWLARYWDQEEQVATELLDRCATRPGDLDLPLLAAGLDRLFPDAAEDDQRMAASCCALARVSVLAGGPGTGKTTTVSRLLALLREQHSEWRVALAAPTGKAAARLEEAVRSSTAKLPPADRQRLGELPATTLHRLLGWRPEARSRFRHDRTNRLPFEVVVVDEASMVSLTMMARLLEALRPATRLVLVGDPDQLASVEAGAVLGDLVDRATLGRRTPGLAAELREVVALPETSATNVHHRAATVEEQPETPAARVRDGVAALVTNRRFPATSGIALLAAAVQQGRGEEALEVLRSDTTPAVELVDVADGVQLSLQQLDAVRADVVDSGTALLDAAERGNRASALKALDEHRLLCAHRRGPGGVQHWSALAARWIADRHPVTPRADGRYAGEPLLVTANDYEIGLYNGDTGVVVDDVRDGLVAVFGRGGEPIKVSLVRLGAVRSMHAMTVHRSQGSQFARITVLLPEAGSPLGTRETLYTAVTRATTHVRVIGSAEAFVAAVERPAARATGLRERINGEL
jgi:exodeoxyribonuclease V alpha subunit